MELSINIISLLPKNSGEEVEIKILISDTKNPEKRETVVFTVFSKMLFEIGNIGVGSLPYSLTSAEYDTLAYDSKLYGAIKKGMDILSYGDNTEKQLVTKLRQRGFDRYISEDGAAYLRETGYIDEKAHLLREAERMRDGKLYGPGRIKAELFKKGFSRDALEGLGEILENTDFSENAYRLIVKKCDTERISDPKYRDSLYRAMYRYGYGPSETKAALRRLSESAD